MGLGGANLVKGATGQTIDNETLGGAMTHNAVSGVAHYRTANEEECIEKIRELVSELPKKFESNVSMIEAKMPKLEAEKLYEILPEDHRQPYKMREVLNCIIDDGKLDEFQSDYAKEMICGTARISGIQVGIIANHRGMVTRKDKPPKFGGIVYTESAEKTAYFIENCNRHGTPILFVQDVSGFMVGADAEHSGIIRAGARFVEAMATATMPKLVLTINHASGAGYYAMAGQGFDPDFIFSFPTGRMGVMEGDSAAVAIFGTQIERLKKEGKEPDEEILAEMEAVRETYEKELDAKYAAARGFVDAIVIPENVRNALKLALETTLNTDKPHIGAFVLPENL
jgi:acetyl-CoA carboxylase carboxyltransferase component